MQKEAATKLDCLFGELGSKDWLQNGYQMEVRGVEDDTDESANELESLEDVEWSHVDSNHGPPACEAGALTS